MDDGEVLVGKGGGDVSGVGGSNAAGYSIPGMFIFGGGSLDLSKLLSKKAAVAAAAAAA